MTYINQLFEGIGQEPGSAGLSQSLSREAHMVSSTLVPQLYSEGIFQTVMQGIELTQKVIVFWTEGKEV